MSKKFGERPTSYYDNYGSAGAHFGSAAATEGGGGEECYANYKDDNFERLRNEMLGYERAKSPTQTISLLTTVPQNITPTNIAGRHAPTRQSLRHSRMIVMNRLGVANEMTPPLLRFHKLAKVLIALQCFLGAFIGFVAFWVFLWTPSIKQRDNPYWSSVPLTLSGLVGVGLLLCYRKEYSGTTTNNCVYSLKVVSIFLSVAAGITCLISASFSVLHLVGLSMMDCEPVLKFNNTCICTLSNDTFMASFMPKTYHYVDLQCEELNTFFVLLLLCSCCSNLLGSLTALWYVYLHWSSKYFYTYSKVHTNNTLSPKVITDDS